MPVETGLTRGSHKGVSAHGSMGGSGPIPRGQDVCHSMCAKMGRSHRMWLSVVWVEVIPCVEGCETDPRQLVSEVGPSETSSCMSGAGGPDYNKTWPSPADCLQSKDGLIKRKGLGSEPVSVRKNHALWGCR